MQKIELIRIYQRKRALVIDDLTDMRGTMRRMLGNFGFAEIDVAGTGEEAIAKCERHAFDIILADYNLGDGKNGQQILEELRFRGLLRHSAAYVMVTAETTRAMVFGALEYQPDDYLTKPFSQPLLQQRLDRLVAEKEALADINQALDSSDWRRAIGLCDERLRERDRYAGRCLRIKAMCHEKRRELTQAQAIYEAAQAERPLEWARIGLGKCLLGQNQLDRAESIFSDLVKNNCQCLEAYDCLAEIKSRRGEVAVAQQLLEQASAISPNAILRQRKLAVISQDNSDWERAEKAHRQVIRLGNNSCYESPENHLSLARCISAHIKVSGSRQRLKEVDAALDRARRHYRNDPQVELQARIIGATALADSGQPERARAALEAVLADSASDTQQPALTLELARAWQAIGDTGAARALLVELADRHPDDEALWDEIDRISDEPISSKGKEQAVALNAEGKQLFASERYADAIRLFGEALRYYPNNIALKLNLLLALVKEMTTRGAEPDQLSRADEIVQSIKNVSTEHPLHERLQVLSAHVARLQTTTA